MANLPGGGYGFWLSADDVAPTRDHAWESATPRLRARFWAEAGRVAAAAWDRSRAAGLDRGGSPLAPISALTAQARTDDVNPVTAREPYSVMGRASASAPPLTATGAASRTRSTLRWKVADEGVYFYWLKDRDTGHYWGEILARHARGFTQFFRYPGHGFGHVPSRDVIGFSPAELAEVKRAMDSWWATERRPGRRDTGKVGQPIRSVRVAPPARPNPDDLFPESLWKPTGETRVKARTLDYLTEEPEGPRRGRIRTGWTQFRPGRGGGAATATEPPPRPPRPKAPPPRVEPPKVEPPARPAPVAPPPIPRPTPAAVPPVAPEPGGLPIYKEYVTGDQSQGRPLPAAITGMSPATLDAWAARIRAAVPVAARTLPSGGGKALIEDVARMLGVSDAEWPAFADMLLHMNRTGRVELVTRNLVQDDRIVYARAIPGTNLIYIRPE